MKKMQLPLYEAPIARNLSGLSVQGQGNPNPYASCQSGTGVISPGCATGPSPVAVGLCSPVGNLVTVAPTCRAGDHALEGCWSGSIYT